MDGAGSTYITNPADKKESKPYSFDYSYWSHDGFIEATTKDGYLHPKPGERYHD
jgi:hypothetical protein